MIEIKPIEELSQGDLILADNDPIIEIIRVDEIEGGLVILKSGMDYAPEDPENIVVIGKDTLPKIKYIE